MVEDTKFNNTILTNIGHQMLASIASGNRKITYTKKPFNITYFLIYLNRKLKSFSKSFIRNLCILLHSQL